MQKLCTWDEIKSLSTIKDISIQELENGDQYHLALIDGTITYFCKLDSDSNEASEYETDYQFKSNKRTSIVEASGTSHPRGMRARLTSIHDDTITAGTSKNIDWKISTLSWQGLEKKQFFDGVTYYAKDSEIGDSVTFQVVDVDGILSPAGTVLEEFSKDWKVFPNIPQEIRLYKARLVPNLYLRVVYQSTGSTDVKFVCNIYRHLDENKNS